MKDSIYFSHDADARNDEKIIGLIMEHGYEGYGIFWAIIEMLRTATDYKMQMDCKRIAFALHTDNAKIESIISDFELFEFDGCFFWSNSLLRRMEKKNSISDSRRKAAQKRWDTANAMQMHSKSNANDMQLQCNKGNERKGNKGKEIKESNKVSVDTFRTEHERKTFVSLQPHFGERLSELNTKSYLALIANLSAENYPGVDICEQIRKAAIWEDSNPTRRKTAKGVPRFLTGWMDRAQNSNRNTVKYVPEVNKRLLPIPEDQRMKPIWED